MNRQLDLIDWLARVPSPSPIGPAVLYRIDAEQNMARFYVMNLTRDLFGNWCLERRWGRIGSRRGQSRLDTHASEGAARDAMIKLRASKQRGGYL